MPNFPVHLPLSLYIHIPWCVRKCPYCDFNSHAQNGALPETEYAQTLIDEMECGINFIQNREIISIFFGGGTPSLFSATTINQILRDISERVAFAPNIEITLEANPGTVDSANFAGFRQAGINRLSLGIQSLQNDKLRALGRIHDKDCAERAIEIATAAGFSNYNIDLMYGLPQQTVDDALADLNAALAYAPPHLSWYQLTIEPNTFFAHHPPKLPSDDKTWDMQVAGQALLDKAGIEQYEVSAYAREEKICRHNQNYWQFGDYLGLGAGAHSKITDHTRGEVLRFSQVRHPRDYLQAEKRLHFRGDQCAGTKIIGEKDLIFEFMLNALRLTNGFAMNLFTERTGLPAARIQALLDQAKSRGFLLADDNKNIQPSLLGKRFLNNLMMLFLQ